jgi:large subunit ribosomal protein L21
MESTIAIVSLGGKQHLVSQGATVVVNKLDAVEGEILDLPDMLANRTVQAKVLSHQLGKKINGLKFKAKTRYFKRYGHRQRETTVEVISLDNPVQKPKIQTEEPVTKKTAPSDLTVGKKVATAKTKKVNDAKD